MNSANDDDPLVRKLDSRLRFLRQDPANRPLLMETAAIGLDAGDPDLALAMLDRAALVAPLTSDELNFKGIAAIKARHFDLAAECFAIVVEDVGNTDAGPRFNLAWSLAVLERSEEALPYLENVTTQKLPQAAALKVQLLHKLGRFDAAIDEAKHLLEHHPEHAPLLAAFSVLALDCEDDALARAMAQRAGDQPDALSTLGTLALERYDAAHAREIFDKALSITSDAPRAWIGRGLARLLQNEPLEAAHDIERGAELFVDHLGSWIAAGWARYVGKDYEKARRCFEHALALDPTFSEAQGSLAVIDIHDGILDKAQERAKIAIRLDPNSFSGAFARTLLLSARGDVDQAKLILERATNTGIGNKNKTISQAITHIGLLKQKSY